MTNQFNHLMIDLETMGSSSFSSIVSIGAVEFDLDTGKTGKEFYRNISLESCIEIGLGCDGSTIMWWLGQNEAARKTLREDKKVKINVALDEFSNFILGMDYKMWGNSARFDLGILMNAYQKAKLPHQWNVFDERCVRTLASFAPDIKKKHQDKGVAHHSIADCKQQIDYCTEIWNKLNKPVS